MKTNPKILLAAFSLIFFTSINFSAAQMVDLGALDITGINSGSSYISADGLAVAGDYDGYGFKYTNSGGMALICECSLRVRDFSSDASTIVGNYTFDNGGSLEERAFKYTDLGDMQNLGVLGDYSIALATSADGSVIVGNYTVSGEDRAFKYTDLGGMEDLGVIVGDYIRTTTVSADGSTIVGHQEVNNGGNFETRAFKLTDLDGIEDLGVLDGGNFSTAKATSADGSVVIGVSNFNNGGNLEDRAFKYTNLNEMQNLGVLSGGDFSSATAISSDGLVIVGIANFNNGGNLEDRAFKYTDLGGMQNLGVLEGGNYSEVSAISADGSVIVGESDFGGQSRAFKYTDANGMQNLGVLEGGTESYATGVSSDGTKISGMSNTASGDYHAFLYTSNLVDLQNTKTVLRKNAMQLNSILSLNSMLLQTTLNQDATLFGKNNISISVGNRTSYNRADNSKNDASQVAGTLKLAYRFSPHFKAGIFLDQNLSSNLPNNFSLQSSMPMTSVFSTFNAQKDGSGIQIRLAAAYNNSELSITRDVMANTEAGRGKSGLISKAALAEVSYGFKLSQNSLIQPFTGLRFSDITRKAYVETSGADFPITFKEASKKSTTAIFGVRLNEKLSEKLETKIGFGFERDLKNSFDGYAGDVYAIGSFNLSPSHIEKTRSFANVGFDYKIAKSQAVGFDLYYSKQSLNSANGFTSYLNYTIGF